MTRAELIAEPAASNPHLRQEDAELIVATIFDQITAALARGGERVELRGFGAFTVKQRNARIGRNPRTGVTVQVGEKTVPHFKTGKEMLRRLNGGSRATSERPTRRLGHPRHWPQWQRLPAGDGAGTRLCLRVVGNAREPLAQLDRSREFAALLVDGADRSGIRLGDDEHRWSMGTHRAAGNTRGR